MEMGCSAFYITAHTKAASLNVSIPRVGPTSLRTFKGRSNAPSHECPSASRSDYVLSQVWLWKVNKRVSRKAATRSDRGSPVRARRLAKRCSDSEPFASLQGWQTMARLSAARRWPFDRLDVVAGGPAIRANHREGVNGQAFPIAETKTGCRTKRLGCSNCASCNHRMVPAYFFAVRVGYWPSANVPARAAPVRDEKKACVA